MEIYKGQQRIPVMQVYQMVLSQAKMWCEEAKKYEKDTFEHDMRQSLASELYAVAANLEATEEVNPTKITINTLFVGGMPIGEIIERDGRKWKVVDNNSTITTTAELVS